MKQSKKDLKKKLMADFKKFGGSTQVDTAYTVKKPEDLGKGIKDSFDKIFPELMKPAKHRKHVIFDDDVFQFFESLCGDNGSKFSSMINSALRSFVRERLLSTSKDNDPVAELLSIRERERELLKEIKELNLVEELQRKLA
jgi:hypothetical protein